MPSKTEPAETQRRESFASLFALFGLDRSARCAGHNAWGEKSQKWALHAESLRTTPTPPEEPLRGTARLGNQRYRLNGIAELGKRRKLAAADSRSPNYGGFTAPSRPHRALFDKCNALFPCIGRRDCCRQRMPRRRTVRGPVQRLQSRTRHRLRPS
jgi:hypothetical protein